LSHSTLADEFQTILSIKVSQQVVLPILDVPIPLKMLEVRFFDSFSSAIV
jgi:hypothetical protein